MRNVSRLFPLLPGIAMLTGCNHASQKNNGQNVQNPNIIYICPLSVSDENPRIFRSSIYKKSPG